MTAKSPPLSLDEILDSIAVEEAEPSYDTLAHWCELYPHYSAELADYFAAWAEQVEQPVTRSLDLDRFASRAVSHALNVLHEQKIDEAAAAKDFASLSQVAKSMGLKDADVAEKLGLDETIVAKLFRRRIVFESIPTLCVERLGDVLCLPLEKIWRHLTGPPLAVSSRRKSRGKASLGIETFAQALESSTLNERQKAEWRNSLGPLESAPRV